LSATGFRDNRGREKRSGRSDGSDWGGSADVDQPDFVDKAARAVENEIACAIEDKNVSCGVDSNHSGIAKKADG
jgi:hypothetical protein